jgi:hypothetical protein
MKAYPADRRGKRFCSGCQAWLPIKLFNGAVVRGKQYLRRVCQACQRTYGTAWWQKNRKGNPKGWRKTGVRQGI